MDVGAFVQLEVADIDEEETVNGQVESTGSVKDMKYPSIACPVATMEYL